MSNEYLNNNTFEKVIYSFQSTKRSKCRCELILKDIKETCSREEKTNKKNNKKTVLQQQEDQYKTICQQYELHQIELTEAFYILSKNLADYYINKYSGVDVDDATQEAVLTCFEKVDRFDPRKGRAFNYMTTCIINHFRQLYRSNKNYGELKKKYQIFLEAKFNDVFRNDRLRNIRK